MKMIIIITIIILISILYRLQYKMSQKNLCVIWLRKWINFMKVNTLINQSY